MDDIIVSDGIRLPLSQLSFEFSRSSGPGGQNVNKVNSKVQLRWHAGSSGLPEELLSRLASRNHKRINTDGELLIMSQRFRDQIKNRADCVEKLRLLLVEAAKPPTIRKKTKTPRRVKESRLRDKKARSATKTQRRRPIAE